MFQKTRTKSPAHRSRNIILATLATALAAPLAAQVPQYGTAEARTVVERMVEAHGGMALWEAASTVSFQHVFYNLRADEGESPWWVSDEMIDRNSDRAYQRWPLDHAVLVDDGRKMWTVNWSKDIAPEEVARAHFNILFLPWISGEAEGTLGTVGRARLSGDETDAITLEYRFGESHANLGGKTVTFYIDPESYLLRGFGYEVDGAQIHHRFVRYGSADGLRVPVELETYSDGQVVGNHFVHDLSLKRPWNSSRVAMPPNAVVHTETTVTPGEY